MEIKPILFEKIMNREINLSQKLKISKKILYAKLLEKYMPLTVSWAITRRCNLDCLYCGVSSVKKEELDTKTIFEIIDKLASLGTERIAFTGGEPLLRDDLGYIIDYARSKGILPVVNTNGKLVKESLHKISKAAKITLSLDGPEHIHNKLRQGESYYEVIEAIKLCKSINIPVVLVTVLTKYNLEYIDFILDVAESFKVKVVFQPALLHILGTNKKSSVAPDLEKYRTRIRMLIKRKMAGDKYIYNSVAGLQHLYLWPEPTKISCWAAKLYCRVDCDGSIYSCGRTVSIHSKSLIDYTMLDKFNLLSKIGITNCKQCWCGLMVEFNLMLSFNINALWNVTNIGL